MSELQKAVLITGAGSGIGKELTLQFALNNENVIALSRRKNLMELFGKQSGNLKGKIHPLEFDLKNIDAIPDTIESLAKKFFITGLINNAGLTSFKKAEEDSFQEIRDIIEVNLISAIFLIKALLPQMIKNNGGTIINILSVVTKKVFAGSSVYSASKSGLLAYSNALREEVRKNNIRVVNISPGATKTPIWPGGALEKYSHRMMSPEELAKLVYDIYSIKSNMVVEEIVVRPISGDI